jgi:hypothetical protein
MKLNDIPQIRGELDKVNRAMTVQWRERLLHRIGPSIGGLLVWYFGAGGETRSPIEVPIPKIEEFVAKYA